MLPDFLRKISSRGRSHHENQIEASLIRARTILFRILKRENRQWLEGNQVLEETVEVSKMRTGQRVRVFIPEIRCQMKKMI